jgi:hypothetical protein
VIESFVPSVVTLLAKRLNRVAESTPKLDLAIFANLAALEILSYLISRVDLVLFLKVLLEFFHAVIVFSTLLPAIVVIFATKGFLLKVLGIFMALPV